MPCRRVAISAVLLLLGASSQPASATATFRGDLPAQVMAVSPDGAVVVGSQLVFGPIPTFHENAWRWEGGVLIEVPNAPNTGAGAGGTSYDGSIFTGHLGNEGFRWENGSVTPLGTLGGPVVFNSRGSDVSWDGSRIVGNSFGGAFVHENGASTPIGSFAALAVSGDGEIIAGARGNAFPLMFTEAIRWQDGIVTGLGDFDGGNFWSQANDANEDGSVIVGFGSRAVLPGGASLFEAARWDDGVMSSLGLPTGANQSIAHAVSADGSVAVGEATLPTSLGSITAAAIFDEQGAQWLEDVLAQTYGLDLSAYDLTKAVGVSADGRTIVGQGIYYPAPEASGQGIGWVVVLPEPATATLVSLGLLALAATRRRG